MTNIVLTSSVGGSLLPFTFGHAFKKGDVPSGSKVQVGSFATQCDIQNTWIDGSAKIAVLTTRATLSAGAATSLALNVAAAPGGSNLTEAALTAALVGKSVTVQCGSIATVSLSDLVGTAALLRTRIAGPLMSEFHYSAAVDSLTTLFFYARVYVDGNVWVGYIVHNGLMLGTGANRVYSNLVVTVNGAVQYDAVVDQKHHTRIWETNLRGLWLGTDPQITPKHDGQYLTDSLLVPNYVSGLAAPTNTVLGIFAQTYTPMGHGNLRAFFGDTGYDDQLGILPRWEGLYILTGDPRTYNSVLVNARSGGSYNIHYMDPATLRPWAFSSSPNYWNSQVASTGGATWSHDIAHQPSMGFLAYLLTGDYRYIEEVQYWATFNAGYISYQTRQGVKCLINGIARQQAWGLRTLAQACVITPDGDSLQTELANSWRSNMVWRRNTYITGSEADPRNKPNGLGYQGLYSGSGVGDPYTPGDFIWVDAPWMQHYFQQAVGYASDLEIPQQTTDDRALHVLVRNDAYRHVVGMLGDSTGRPYPNAAYYTCVYGRTATANEISSSLQTYANWTEQWADEKVITGFAEPNSSPGGPLLGSSGGDPLQMATGFWGNLHPAIAYAVQHEAPGALAAWTRMTTASNYAAGKSSFRDNPLYGVFPRVAASLQVLYTYTVGTGATVYGGITNEVEPPDPVPGMPSWLASKALYEWVAVPNSTLSASPVQPSALSTGFGLQTGLVNAENGTAVDRRNSELWQFGGGHLDWAGNEVMSLILSVESPAWVLRRDHSVAAAITPASWPSAAPSFYTDGRPASRHAYQGTHFIEKLEKYLAVGGYIWPNANGNLLQPVTFDKASGDWDPAGTWNATFPTAPGGGNGIFAKHPVTEDIYFGCGGDYRFYKLDTSTKVWSLIANPISGYFPAFECAAILPSRNAMFVISTRMDALSASYGCALFSLTNGARTNITINPSAALTAFKAQNTNHAGVFYNPDADEFYYSFGGTGNGGKLFRITPNATNTWSMDELSMTGATVPAGIGVANGNMLTRVGYLPQLKAVFSFSSYNSPIYVARVG